jgi:TatD DNase family protein
VSSRRERPPAPEPLAPLIDAHTHLDACGAADADDVHAILDRAEAVGVKAVVTIADDLEAARWAVRAADWDPRVYAAVALHPTRANALTDAAQAEIEGLAKRTGKPLMIHNRDADAAVLDVLAAEGAPATVIFHCFSSGPEMARTCVDAGWLLSLSGTVSFRNARDLREAAALIPPDQLLVETDAPFLTPHPFRGAPNESYCLPYTVRALAEVVGRPAVDLARETCENAVRTYGFRT